MLKISPLAADVLFHLGPVPIDRAVVTTWAIMAALCLTAWLGLRRPSVQSPTALQSALEILVEAIDHQVAEVTRRDPVSLTPLLGTLFLFLVVANLSAVVPGMSPPTGHLETPAALAAIVFLSAHWYGIRARGLSAYLRHYTRPSLFLLPLNVLAELTRTFSMMVRLFGNMMSHEMVIAIIAFLAGLLLPIPFLLLGVLIGIIQAYIFTILASVYIGAAISGEEA